MSWFATVLCPDFKGWKVHKCGMSEGKGVLFINVTRSGVPISGRPDPMHIHVHVGLEYIAYHSSDGRASQSLSRWPIKYRRMPGT